ncbi:hypothetical protein [Shewanella baltica]|uniref:hypothetical protein n=1 Tax=Shewanella baltica TaxID=62322 RepID=UPI00217EB40B|nr:hypothetical protein [Shewanella baltica]MCS6241373.1 hypothetical protein [Shewanella baltica]
MYVMVSNTHMRTHYEMVCELNNALTWLDNILGIRSKNTRIDKYHKLLSTADSLNSNEDYKDYILTKKEVDEFLLIYTAFKNEPKENILKQVKFSVSGAYYRQDSNPEKAEPSRDYLLELSVAARLKLSGIEVQTNNICDVVAKYHEKYIYIECKRVRGKNKLLQRVKEASNQISKRIGLKKLNAFGYIMIDVTDLLSVGKNIDEYKSFEHMKTYPIARLKEFSEKYNHDISKLVGKKICGIIFYAHFLGVINLDGKLQPYNFPVYFAAGNEGTSLVKKNLNSEFLPHLLT